MPGNTMLGFCRVTNYVFVLILLYLIWVQTSQHAHFTALYFFATGFRDISEGSRMDIVI